MLFGKAGFRLEYTSSILQSTLTVFLEAMACGVSVVTTDSGGVKEYAISQQTAVVVPPKNPEALAKGVSKGLENKKLRLKLVRNGLKG